ncbi:MAG: DMT family transporter [Rhizobiaceae bacterium]
MPGLIERRLCIIGCRLISLPRLKTNLTLLMITTSRDYQLGLTLVFIAVVAWSTAGLFTKLLSVDTPTILFWRSLYGAIATLIVIAVLPDTGGLSAFRRLNRHGIAYASITALSMLFFISALRNTSVAHVAVITAIVPFLAAYFGWAFLKEAPSRSAIVASAVALLGVAMMVGVGSDGALFGDALAVVMAIGMAAMILISRRYPGIPALPATCVACALTAIATLPFATLSTVPEFDMWLLALFGLVNQVLGFGLFALGARLLPPSETALLTCLEAPLAPLWVWIVLSEQPQTATILGGLLVMTAVIAHLRQSTH